MVNWNYWEKFRGINKKYMPERGEGETKATQIVTAVNTLVYKWYNDGDVFDNTHYLDGWINDLSSFANWLDKNGGGEASSILHGIAGCNNYCDYEDLLKNLSDLLLDENYLAQQNAFAKVGSIYKCEGDFKFENPYFS